MIVFYVLLVLSAFVTYTQQQVKDPAFIEKWKKTKADCATQQGVDLAAVTKYWNDDVFPEDNKIKCFYKCTTTALGVLDANGDVVDAVLGSVAAHFIDSKTNAEIVEECGPIKGSDLCETAYKLLKCIKAAELD